MKVRLFTETQFNKHHPDIPFAEGVDVNALTERDIEAGRKPFFVTLPIGFRDAVSENGRIYIGDVALNAIYKAILENRIAGRRGHTSMFEDDSPAVFQWVGAVIEGDTVWGKAYIIPTQSGLDLREEYAAAMAAKRKVSTSLEGEGEAEWNKKEEMYEIHSLTVDWIDSVTYPGIKNASAVPHITQESNLKGIRGSLMIIENDEQMASEMQAIISSDGEGDAMKRLTDEGYSMDDITRLMDAGLLEMPMTSDDDDMEEAHHDDMEESSMPEEIADARIVEMREQHQNELRELNQRVLELEASKRQLDRVVTELGIEEGADPVLHIQTLKAKNTVLVERTRKLMKATINEMVGETVAVEKMRSMIAERVFATSPLTEDEARSAMTQILEQPDVSELLKWGAELSAGPPQDLAGTTIGADIDTSKIGETKKRSRIVIPSMGATS